MVGYSEICLGCLENYLYFLYLYLKHVDIEKSHIHFKGDLRIKSTLAADHF